MSNPNEQNEQSDTTHIARIARIQSFWQSTQTGDVWRVDELRYFARMVTSLVYKDAGVFPDMDRDDYLALTVACQCLNWFAREPEEIKVVRRKLPLTFSAFTLGDTPDE